MNDFTLSTHRPLGCDPVVALAGLTATDPIRDLAALPDFLSPLLTRPCRGKQY